ADDLEEPCIVAVVAEPQLDAVQGEVGGDGLRRGAKRRVAAAEVAVLIFERCAPLPADRDPDTGPQRPAGSPERRVLDRRGPGESAARQLVVGPGKPRSEEDTPELQ